MFHLAVVSEFMPETRALDEKLRSLIDLYKVRSRTLVELSDQLADYYIADDEVAYDEAAMKKHLKGENLEQRLADVRSTLESDQAFTIESTEAAVRTLAESNGIGAGKYIHPLRVALVGKMTEIAVRTLGPALAKQRVDGLKRAGTLPDESANGSG